jgi:glycerol-3-phosphate O-acyltransferase
LLQQLKPDVHLSRNASKYLDPATLPSEMLVTRRERNISKDDFMRLVDESIMLMQQTKLPIPVTVHRERVIYDDNVQLDAGWLK